MDVTKARAEALERETDRASSLEQARIAFLAAWDALR
jgi:hypothetical protein